MRNPTIITRLCQLILYITAQNADVRELNWPGKKGRRPAGPGNSGPLGIRDKYREIKGWDVGYRIVDKMTAVKQEQTAAREGEEYSKQSERRTQTKSGYRMPPVPHLRCGNWQTFWTGKREPNNPDRKLLLKWLAPTFVNCGYDPAKRMPVTINRYRTEQQLKVKSTGEKETAYEIL